MKKLVNTSIDDIIINDMGITIFASSEYTINSNEYPLWANSSDVLVYIDDGRIRGNDGIRNLPPYLTAMMLRHDIAENIGFDNSTNGFIAQNTQAAIEEIRSFKNFSYRRIPSGRIVMIPEEQQMTVYQELKIDQDAELVVYGEVVIK